MNQNKASIHSPEYLHITEGSTVSFGANQNWYSTIFQRMAGCGPTAASNLIWYLTATRPMSCNRLCARVCTEQPNMLHLMKQVWKYVTPGLRGVDKTSILANGVVRFADERQVPLRTAVLDVSPERSQRPSPEEVHAFLSDALLNDLPVAFLNLGSGRVDNLDNWHWVTLVSVDRSLKAEMYDQGVRQDIDLALWLSTAARGGGFVTFDPIALRGAVTAPNDPGLLP